MHCYEAEERQVKCPQTYVKCLTEKEEGGILRQRTICRVFLETEKKKGNPMRWCQDNRHQDASFVFFFFSLFPLLSR